MADTTKVAPELDRIEFEAIDRSSFLLKGILAASAAYGAFAAGPLLRKAFAQTESDGDIEILNFALTLEFLEATFYELAQKQTRLSDEVDALAKLVGGHEREHVEALTQTIEDLGGKPVKEPRVDFAEALSNEQMFLSLAVTLEDTGVSAYNGVAPQIESKELLATAGTIVQIEARHASAIRFVADEVPAPDAFDPTLTVDEVNTAAAAFLERK